MGSKGLVVRRGGWGVSEYEMAVRALKVKGLSINPILAVEAFREGVRGWCKVLEKCRFEEVRSGLEEKFKCWVVQVSVGRLRMDWSFRASREFGLFRDSIQGW